MSVNTIEEEDVIDRLHPLSIVVTDKHVRTRSHPASVIKVLQRRYAAGEERILQCGGITEPTKQGEMSPEVR